MRIIKNLLVVHVLLLSACLFGQEQTSQLDGSERQQLEEKILSASKNIQTLRANFIQERTSTLLNEKSTSEGLLLYKAVNSLRWEYIKPMPMALVLNGNEVWLVNENGASNSSKMFKQLANLIISTINGEGLTDSKNFKTNYYIDPKDKNVVYAELIPINRRIKEFYNLIRIKIRTADYLASEILLEEKSGDTTRIILSDKKINLAINATSFAINP